MTWPEWLLDDGDVHITYGDAAAQQTLLKDHEP